MIFLIFISFLARSFPGQKLIFLNTHKLVFLFRLSPESSRSCLQSWRRKKNPQFARGSVRLASKLLVHAALMFSLWLHFSHRDRGGEIFLPFPRLPLRGGEGLKDGNK